MRENFISILVKLVHEKTFGEKQFQLDNENSKAIDLVCAYLNNEIEVLNKENFSAHKGLWIAGNFGSGKTLIMEAYGIFKKQFFNETVGFKTTIDINKMFIEVDKNTRKMNGIESLFVYANKFDKVERTFDDLGAEETTIQDYGNKFSPMAYILLERQKGFIHGVKTHVTTNLTIKQISDVYGGRIHSRVHEVYNIIKLGASRESIDYRLL